MDPLQDQPPPKNLDEVEEILGYNFKNKCLLEEAFTHSSYYYTTDNNYNEAEIKCSSFERLAYLGDAVLNLLVTKEQFFLYSDFSSGQLTRLRAANVDTEKLARVAIEHGLHYYLCHKTRLLEERVNGFKKEILEYPIHSNELVDVPKCLADLVESIIGAIFIDSDSNADIVWQVFRRLLEPLIDAETLKTHPVTTKLYQICQKHNLKVQFKDSWEDLKAGEVLVNNEWVGISGACRSKKEIAFNSAAQNALKNIPTILSIKLNNSTLDEIREKPGWRADLFKECAVKNSDFESVEMFYIAGMWSETPAQVVYGSVVDLWADDLFEEGGHWGVAIVVVGWVAPPQGWLKLNFNLLEL
ncbi:ribonuclease 3-like protein 3 [Neltuma alba]|uniref:ribonuclease 3-like protein 3 n=1 Tax=Neltuma alba TaxID=207710 RepID=UPI0010A42BAB|nr:ribonuclease 3-like protein 3 [Prosopis alba]